MSVASTVTPSKAFAGDGSTVTFNLPFVFMDAADLQVVERVIATGVETAKSLGVDYTVSGGGGLVGAVTAATAPAASVQWIVRRRAVMVQSGDFEAAAPEPTVLMQILDRLTLMCQELRLVGDRSLRLPMSDGEGLAPELPSSVARASSYLAFDASGNPVAVAKEVALALMSAFGESLTDDADAGAALTTLGFSAFVKTLVAAADKAALRALLGVPIRAFVAHKNGTNQTAVADGVWTKMTATTEILDTHGIYDAANSRATPGIAGWTLFFARAAWVSTEDAAVLGTHIYMNGSAPSFPSVAQASASGASGFQGPLCIGLILHDTDDYFEAMAIWDGSSGTKDILGSVSQSFFAGITFLIP